MKKRWLLLIIIGLLLIGGGIYILGARPRVIKVGERAPDFVLPDRNGKKVSLYSLLDKPVILVFGEPGCKACVEFMVKLDTILFPKFEGKFHLVSIRVPMYGKFSKREYTMKHSFVYLIGDEKIKKKYIVRSIPASYVIDTKGIIRAWEIGNEPGVVEEEFVRLLTELTKEVSP